MNVQDIEFTRVKNDVNGNPRWVAHFLDCEPKVWRERRHASPSFDTGYLATVKLMNKIGGRKFHNKQFGGGIVFQSYSLDETANSIRAIIAKQS